MKKVKLVIITFLLVLFTGVFGSTCWAIPDLQLYIPGADYIGSDPDAWIEDSWFTENSAFELWVLVANNDFEDLNLVLAAPDDESGTVSLTSLTDGFDDGFYELFYFGSPVIDYNHQGDPAYLPGHGVYDTHFAEHNLGSVEIGDDDVYDMVGGGGPKEGKIIKFDVVKTGFSRVHFDLYGDGRFAPFSHDAEDGPIPPPVPEPVTMLLFGAGALGLFLNKRKS